jgi:hypothetical protein
MLLCGLIRATYRKSQPYNFPAGQRASKGCPNPASDTQWQSHKEQVTDSQQSSHKALVLDAAKFCCGLGRGLDSVRADIQLQAVACR